MMSPTLVHVALWSLGLTLVVGQPAMAHSGGTDASGCHHNRRTGDYHCHGGSGSSGSSGGSSWGGSSGWNGGSGGGGNGGSGAPGRSVPLEDAGNVIELGGSARSASRVATVVSVGDGDTLRINDQGQTVTVRLACIDAPEMAQAPYGAAARNRLQQWLPAGTPVSLRVVDTDRYGRTVAEVFSQNVNLNVALVQEGHAVAYRDYLSNCNAAQYLQVEGLAKQRRLNFWGQANPTMPWEFRRSQRQ